ncbi:glycoside hydrolase family 2 protein [Rhizobium sp. TRM96647]|uniref:glycosyl hydrolase 2 galactose-binding domain-containing protein n=1 Tax=unclassified Rhizobium TaxID=2613769 RepID=UPI0021E8852C|nr:MULTISPECIES: glycoside hydrolase family 2 protein [unclassified Rhizobium]MCV3736313.1 glycoside hydrolase family 2 protein [Rhizobium sp. TRM96647]MCV3758682.1 glycoside hydrolase family 2 protein [Rhizobium sp. TRM96650]
MSEAAEGTSPQIVDLEKGWKLCLVAAGAWSDPSMIGPDVELLDAPVPGTVAGALERAGRFDRDDPMPLDGYDAWYLLERIGETPGPAVLVLEGLATIADVYWNGELRLSSHSMFVAHEIDVQVTGRDRLAICFRALSPHLERRGPRARWRPQMIVPQGIRLTRTTLLGRMPGWCPSVHALGPYRPVRLVRPQPAGPADIRMAATLAPDGTGHLAVSFLSGDGARPALLRCAGVTAAMERGADGRWQGNLAIPDVAAWWPHTHGRPVLHGVEVDLDGESHALGRTGFRRIDIDTGADGRGFALRVNGVPVFCRGAVWTNADIVDLPGTRAAYEPTLRLAAGAGMNLLRIGGTMAYESNAFFELCDELGILVWQDVMLANFDYPAADRDFVALLKTEVEQFLQGTAASPALAVLCGGSEVFQQAAMLGLPAEAGNGPLTDAVLPEIVRALRPDVPFVPNSPFGGAMPFSSNAGVAHYYGVGAYCRPLEDARRAGVRFAAESLAFANVPEQVTLDAHLPVPAVHDPRWKSRVPRDRGASWDFEDVRDHYLGQLYDCDPARLRREDPLRYLDVSRAVSGEVMEATYAEWRRPQSSCNGALVWTLQDLMPGAGWGVVDATGLPKPAWHALRRAFRPLQVLLSDEGTNGLDVHVINETDQGRELTVELTCLRDGRQPVVTGRRALMLAARGVATFAATDLFGAFFDTTYAFRFGPPAHDVTIASLQDGDGPVIVAEAFHFPQGRARALHAARATVALEEVEGGWQLRVGADRLLQSAHIDCPGFLPSDSWFHLSPGRERVIRLVRTGAVERPGGELSALNLPAPVSF